MHGFDKLDQTYLEFWAIKSYFLDYFMFSCCKNHGENDAHYLQFLFYIYLQGIHYKENLRNFPI